MSNGDNPVFNNMIDELRDVDECRGRVDLSIIDDIMQEPDEILRDIRAIRIPTWKEPKKEPIDSPGGVYIALFVVMIFIILGMFGVFIGM